MKLLTDTNNTSHCLSQIKEAQQVRKDYQTNVSNHRKAQQKSSIPLGCFNTIETYSMLTHLIAKKGAQWLSLRQPKAL